MQEIKTIQDFYSTLKKIQTIRKEIVLSKLENNILDSRLFDYLKSLFSQLENVKKTGNKSVFRVTDSILYYIDLKQLFSLHQKDCIFLEKSEKEFIEYLDSVHLNFNSQVKEGVKFLSKKQIQHFITDRDGTILTEFTNYLLTVQPIYVSYLVGRYARSKIGKKIIFTAVPLNQNGFNDVNTFPSDLFISCGSFGFEIQDTKNNYKQFELDTESQQLFDLLTKKILHLYSEEKWNYFRYMESGLRIKTGNMVIPYYDEAFTLNKNTVQDFKYKILDCIKEIDADLELFRIYDHQNKLFITLNKYKNQLINKASGFDFITEHLQLDRFEGNWLVCGNSEQDISFLQKIKNKNKNTSAIFVTRDDKIKQKVLEICKDSFFVTEPDILISILYNSR